jgi:hypothetical protein
VTPAGGGETAVPRPPTRAAAAAAALAAGAAGVAALAPSPRPPEVERGADPVLEAGIPVAEPDGAAPLGPRVAGLSSDDPVVRRESAGVVERLAAVPDAQVRLALAAALRRDGSRPARLALLLLAGDGDARVRRVARGGGGDRGP